MRYIAIVFAMIVTPAFAQDAQQQAERARAAAPFLAQQLHDAVDNLALCQGDQAVLRQQLAEAKAEIEKLKAAPPK